MSDATDSSGTNERERDEIGEGDSLGTADGGLSAGGSVGEASGAGGAGEHVGEAGSISTGTTTPQSHGLGSTGNDEAGAPTGGYGGPDDGADAIAEPDDQGDADADPDDDENAGTSGDAHTADH